MSCRILTCQTQSHRDKLLITTAFFPLLTGFLPVFDKNQRIFNRLRLDLWVRSEFVRRIWVQLRQFFDQH